MGDIPHMMSSLNIQGSTKITPLCRKGVGNKTVIRTAFLWQKILIIYIYNRVKSDRKMIKLTYN